MSNIDSIKLKKVPIVLDKQRNLVYDMNAFAELEEQYGTIETAMKKMESGSIKALKLLLWAGLVHEDEKLTQRQVGSWLSPVHLEEMSPLIEEALQNSMPKKEEEETEGVEKEHDALGNQ